MITGIQPSRQAAIFNGMSAFGESIGWLSSFILVLTIGKQIYKQWHDQTSSGVSKWLFLGQIGSSIGFIIYSWLLHNWVFVITNAILFLANILGLCIVLHHRKQDA